MLLSSDEVTTRLESPENLINRLRSRVSDPRTYLSNVPPKENNPDVRIVTMPPSIDDLVDNIDSKLKLSSMQDKATEVLDSALTELRTRLPEIQRPEKLAAVAADMGKLIGNIREQRGNQTNNIQVMIYAPELRSEDVFDVVSVQET